MSEGNDAEAFDKRPGNYASRKDTRNQWIDKNNTLLVGRDLMKMDIRNWMGNGINTRYIMGMNYVWLIICFLFWPFSSLEH